jgi:LPXTG-site transpeptidase (sortase) family protein
MEKKQWSRETMLRFAGWILILVGGGSLIGLEWYSAHITEKNSGVLVDFDPAGGASVVSSTTSTYTIRIPKINFEMPIVVGQADENQALDNGAWLIPGTAIPGNDDEYRNTVIAEHRFREGVEGKYVFFEADRLVPGDEIYITTGEKEIRYIVSATEVVEPTAVEILAPTEIPTLTLFTCTPKFSSKFRLVIYAHPSE